MNRLKPWLSNDWPWLDASCSMLTGSLFPWPFPWWWWLQGAHSYDRRKIGVGAHRERIIVRVARSGWCSVELSCPIAPMMMIMIDQRIVDSISYFLFSSPLWTDQQQLPVSWPFRPNGHVRYAQPEKSDHQHAPIDGGGRTEHVHVQTIDDERLPTNRIELRSSQHVPRSSEPATSPTADAIEVHHACIVNGDAHSTTIDCTGAEWCFLVRPGDFDQFQQSERGHSRLSQMERIH